MSQYAQPDDLINYSLTPQAYSQMDQNSIVPMLQASSSLLDSFFTSQFVLPLIADAYGHYDPSLVMFTCHIAAYYLWQQAGLPPLAAGLDELIKRRYNEALQWAKAISNQEIFPPFVDSHQSNQILNQPQISTSPNRGWNRCGSGGVFWRNGFNGTGW